MITSDLDVLVGALGSYLHQGHIVKDLEYLRVGFGLHRFKGFNHYNRYLMLEAKELPRPLTEPQEAHQLELSNRLPEQGSPNAEYDSIEFQR